LWEGVIEHEMLPEPVTVNIRITHEGSRVIAVASSPDFPEEGSEEIEGKLEGKTITFEIPTEIGPVVITAEIDAPDHANVVVMLGGFGSIEFELFRIEVGETGQTISVAKKKAKKDNGPQAPDSDWKLEGLRSLFEGRGVALVEANRKDEIQMVVQLFAEFKLPVRILGGLEADQVAELLLAHQVGVVVEPPWIRREENNDFVPAARLRQLGIATAFQSESKMGARFLPRALSMATRYGLGADQALEGLTSGAAKLLGIDDHVGSLRPGMDGDVVIHTGFPFDLRSRITTVFVNGEEVLKP
jgi:hypothetical protein